MEKDFFYNVISYLDMRGDISFEADPFNDVDNVLLAQLSYLDFTGIVGAQSDVPVSLPAAVRQFFELHEGEDLKMGAILPDTYFEMLYRIGRAPRFCNLALSSYRYVLREEDESGRKVQWTALTVLIDERTMYISFAGTDDTIASWKEDLDMVLREVVPSQEEAAAYVREMLEKFPGYDRVMIGGHSKGGNLAVYAAACCPPPLQERILRVFDNDGPGFSTAFLSSSGYAAIRGRIVSIVPEQTVVGLMFRKDTKPCVVKSSGKGAFQHDTFTWGVKCGHLDRAPGIAHDALVLGEATARWLGSLNSEEKETVVETFYGLLTGADAKTLTDLSEDPLKLFSSFRRVTPEGRRALRGALHSFLLCRRQVAAEYSKDPLLTAAYPSAEEIVAVSPSGAPGDGADHAAPEENGGAPDSSSGGQADAPAAEPSSPASEEPREDAKKGGTGLLRTLFRKEEPRPVLHVDGSELYEKKPVKKKR